ncbi:MAG TPA: hypothetical protein IGR64_02410, partial [Leptolyngbyaceae cyanobacterium M65_K2018_010]|nr:hypothetical protein [Leptolyngbyaceae cyanobacterium M65_K2018_010]
VEIHTQAGRQTEVADLWQRLQPWRSQLKLISISCPDHPQVVAYLRDLYAIMTPLDIPLIWQTDGRPMSGDLGKGTTHATIRLAEKILKAGLPGYVQVAGGTNAYTVSKLRRLGLLREPRLARCPDQGPGAQTPAPTVAGIAYGSYARSLVRPLLEKIDLEIAQGSSWVGGAWPPGGQPIDKLAPFWPCSNRVSVPKMESTSALVQGLIQARQLVGALKDGGG